MFTRGGTFVQPKEPAVAYRRCDPDDIGPLTRREVPDAACPGLRLIIQAKTGTNRLRCGSESPNGSHAKLTLGPYDRDRQGDRGRAGYRPAPDPSGGKALATSVDRERAMGVDVVEERRAAKSRRVTAAAHREASAFGRPDRVLHRPHDQEERTTTSLA